MEIPSLKHVVSEEEWQLRCDLAACYRLIALYGWSDLGHAHFLMLRNHGLLTVGRTIADAFLNMYLFETTCQIQLAAQASSELTFVNPAILDGVAQASRVQTGGQGGLFVWPAMLRKLDRIDPGYRT